MMKQRLIKGLYALVVLGCSGWVWAQVTLEPMPNIPTKELSLVIQTTIEDRQLRLTEAQAADADDLVLAQRWGDLGDVFLVHGLLSSAAVAYRNAERLAPTQLDWPYLLSIIAYEQGQLVGAEQALNRALEIDSWDRSALIRRGRIALDQGQTEQAMADFARVLQLDPESAAALAGLGEAALQAQRFDQAIDYLTQALNRQPTATRLNQPLALAYRGAGQIEAARALMGQTGDRDVAFLDPVMDRVREQSQSPQFYQEAALAAAEAGQWTDARVLLVQALSLAPNDPVIVANYGEVLVREGLFTEARDAFLRLIELSPNDPNAWFYLAQTEEVMGQTDAAKVAYQRLASLDDQDIRGPEGLAFVDLAQGRFTSAEEQFNALAQRADTQDERYRLTYWQAIAQLGGGEYDQAHQKLMTLNVESNASDRDVLIALIRLRASVVEANAEQQSESMTWAESMYEAQPDVETAATLAMAYAGQGQFFDAQDFQAQAMFEALRGGTLDGREDLKQEMTWYQQDQAASRPFGLAHPIFSGRSLP